MGREWGDLTAGTGGYGTADVRLLGRGEGCLLTTVAEDVFDGPIRDVLAAAFLEDPRHHLAVAIKEGRVVGIASGVHYIHPDKDPELWINEVGVAPEHRRRGLARRLVGALLDHGRELGCREAWVLTEGHNAPARQLYEALGGVQPASETVMYSFDLRP